MKNWSVSKKKFFDPYGSNVFTEGPLTARMKRYNDIFKKSPINLTRSSYKNNSDEGSIEKVTILVSSDNKIRQGTIKMRGIDESEEYGDIDVLLSRLKLRVPPAIFKQIKSDFDYYSNLKSNGVISIDPLNQTGSNTIISCG